MDADAVVERLAGAVHVVHRREGEGERHVLRLREIGPTHGRMVHILIGILNVKHCPHP